MSEIAAEITDKTVPPIPNPIVALLEQYFWAIIILLVITMLVCVYIFA